MAAIGFRPVAGAVFTTLSRMPSSAPRFNGLFQAAMRALKEDAASAGAHVRSEIRDLAKSAIKEGFENGVKKGGLDFVSSVAAEGATDFPAIPAGSFFGVSKLVLS